MPRQSKLIQYFCNACGKEMLQYERASKGRKKRYCSLACRHKGLMEPDEIRFYRFLSAPDANGCINWTGMIACGTGYGRLRKTGSRKKHDCHRFAYELAHGQIPAGMCVCHKCDNRKCCNQEHLFLGTKAENNRDKCDKGRQTKGVDCHLAKLTEEDVRAIRHLASEGRARHEIARGFGMSKNAVRYIIRRETWKHV